MSTLYIGSAVVKCTICLMLMLYVRGEGVSLPNKLGGSALRPNPYSLVYLIFDRQKIYRFLTQFYWQMPPLSHTFEVLDLLCIYLNGFSKFSWLFSQPQNASFSPYEPFSRPKNISTLSYTSAIEFPTLLYTWSLKSALLGGASPCRRL